MTTTISVRGLTKTYRVDLRGQGGAGSRAFRIGMPQTEIHALKNVSFDVSAGDRLGVIGRNGSGKSTLLKILSRVIYPTSGEAVVTGKVTSLLEVGTGFDDALSGRENIYLNAALHGLTREDVRGRLEEIVEFAEIGRFIDVPIKHYSSGMRSRLAFAVAAHLDADILMLDEVLAVGDLSFQQKCLQRVNEMTGETRSLLFVSHAMDSVMRFCNRCIWLRQGEIAMDGEASEVCTAYVQDSTKVSATYVAAPKPAPQTVAPESEIRVNGAAIDEANAAELVSAQVLDELGEPARAVKVDTPCAIELVFDVLRPDARVEPALHFRNDRGDILFVVAFISDDAQGPVDRVGRYRAVLQIPPHLLNIGYHGVTVALVTADPLIRHVQAENVVSFTVFEHHGEEPDATARGRYARTFPGGLRPRLPWSLAPVGGGP